MTPYKFPKLGNIPTNVFWLTKYDHSIPNKRYHFVIRAKNLSHWLV